jgi:hypothetical protein
VAGTIGRLAGACSGAIDEAPYRAKELGRNRVVAINAEDASPIDGLVPAGQRVDRDRFAKAHAA